MQFRGIGFFLVGFYEYEYCISYFFHMSKTQPCLTELVPAFLRPPVLPWLSLGGPYQVRSGEADPLAPISRQYPLCGQERGWHGSVRVSRGAVGLSS